MGFKTHDLDPAHFYYATGSAWIAVLKMTKSSL